MKSITVPVTIFISEKETFWTLLHNKPHWEFEIFLMILFDVILGILIWPFIKKHWKHHLEHDKEHNQD